MQKYIKFLLLALVVAILVPQITLAAWWNPVSWGLWGKIWSTIHKTSLVQKANVCRIDNDCSGVTCQGIELIVQSKCVNGKCEQGKCPIVNIDDQTANWKTYTNAQYGYEIKYPENWVPIITDIGILLTTPEHAEQNKNNQNILPPVFDFSAGYTTNDWFLKNAKNLTGKEFTNLKNFLKDAYGNVAEINVDGKKAYSTIVSTSNDDYSIYIETGKNTYISLTMPYVGLQPGFDPKNPKLTAEAKNILSTFKFTK